MNRLRHWSASLISRVDWMVGMVENHEALADSAIRDLGRHAARARVQMGRVRADGKRLRARLGDERDALVAWRERARRLATTEEARALECVRRSKASERRIREFESRLAEHDRIEHQLAQDLGRVEEKLSAMKSQRNLMRTRESRAVALSAVGECQEMPELDDVFERWDTRITEREIVAGCGEESDALEWELAEEEAEDALRDELSRLVAEEIGTSPAT
ncbi:MAG: PspA/IM30 family protein [Myxococcota bacterium]